LSVTRFFLLLPIGCARRTNFSRIPTTKIHVIIEANNLSKRRLTNQQNARIALRRQVGDGEVQDDFDSALGPEQEGLVLSHFRTHADIETDDKAVVRCNLRANLGSIVAGDRVLWRKDDNSSGVVTAIYPRISELQRPDGYGKLRLVAANVTRAVITLAPEPEPHPNLIDRYLVVAEHLGLEPVLLVNKCELVDPESTLPKLFASYVQLGYPVHLVSARSGLGMEQLRQHLSSGTTIFVGQSGVGKSSVIQNLLPDEQIKVGALSEVMKKGRHTTTHARLYHFPSGGDCIDSPGIREFGLWHLTEDDVTAGFRELNPLMGRCRFRNCRHQQEPNCALLDARAKGAISPERFQSYQTIVASLGNVTMHE
jgi:ribosome biogenesis GTPase / thiamine phosphate phosphatase